ncbi:unnamed protein product [Ilex paraguariensis]|uniref:UDP-glucuronate decarboxylase n=1 Tax=Ilex paraguariensis TaxID=185542 RepID=A0ABC8RGZ4_9AQUA
MTNSVPGDDPHQRTPDISKAKEQLCWEPKLPLRKGLRMMVSNSTLLATTGTMCFHVHRLSKVYTFPI